MTIFFTSDQHFGHANILKYEDESRRAENGRRFKTVEEMDEYLIDQWNATVTSGDLVYCLGDFSYKRSSMEFILPFLNGTKFLITGNHDPFFKEMLGARSEKADARASALQCGFDELYWQHAVEIPGIGIVQLSHFPYHPTKEMPELDPRYLELRPKPGKEAVLLHGHVHSQWLTRQYPGMPLMINLGVEMWGMRPVPEETLVNVFQNWLRY